jgi:23S rRNA (guanosine2251-2'-O)-methyltransferase
VTSSPEYQRKKAFFDRVLTVYGRKPVLEALQDNQLECHSVHLADSNKPSTIIGEIERTARARQVPVKWHSRAALSRISRNGKQDQGAAVDIICPGFSTLDDYLDGLAAQPAQRLLALDGITNPQNLGMILRSAAAGFIDGLIWSARGNAALGPLVIKASAGTIYRAPLLKCEDLEAGIAACRAAGIEVCTLEAEATRSLFEHRPSGHCVYVLGNETSGVSAAIHNQADARLRIPMRNGVESLNVAVTAGLVAYATSLQYQSD